MIDVVAPLVAAVKFQSAFYEAYGPPGVAAMHSTAAYAHEKGLIVIIDGKRNDIGSTAEAYARGYLGKVPIGGSFEPSGRPTPSPSIPTWAATASRRSSRSPPGNRKASSSWFAPAMRRPASFRTSSPTASPLYRHVADRLHSGPSRIAAIADTASWVRSSARPTPNNWPNCARHFPASSCSCPATAARVRRPATSPAAFDEDGLGALINNSRGITFAYQRPAYHARFGDDWQAAVAQAVRDMIDDLAANTNAGRLRDTAKVAN